MKRLLAFAWLLSVGCVSREVPYGKNPWDPHPVDSDNDYLTDFEETTFTGTDPFNADSDGDGLPDGWEYFSGLDPLNPCGLDGPDGIVDASGRTNLEVYRQDPDKYRNRGLFYVVPKE